MANKVWFHAGAPCNGCTGIGEMWQQLEAAGIPFGVYSVDGGGLVAVDGLKYRMAKTLIYRPSKYDYAPYHVEATTESAAAYWSEIAAALRGPDVAYVLVTTPDPLSVREVRFFA